MEPGEIKQRQKDKVKSRHHGLFFQRVTTQCQEKWKKVKRGSGIPLKGCVGIGFKLQQRVNKYNCNSDSRLRCHTLQISTNQSHPETIKNDELRHGNINTSKSDDWISEHLYKKYTETDSRPISPDIIKYQINRQRNNTISSRDKSIIHQRRCFTPDPPEMKFCQIHNPGVLILDLRKVKSVDVVARQNSFTSTGTGSFYEEDDDEVLKNLRGFPKNSSMYRSTTPKIEQVMQRTMKKEKSSLTCVESSGNKIFNRSIPPLHSSVLTLLGNRSSGNPSPRQGTVQIISPATKQKLRRHGRRRKSESTEKNGVDKVEDKDRIEGDDGSGSKGTIALENTDDTTTSEVGSNGRRDSQELTPQPSTQLYQILDKSLSRTRWYLSNDEIHTEIHLLEKVLGKSENKLRNNRKEDDLVSMSLIPNTQQQRSLKSS